MKKTKKKPAPASAKKKPRGTSTAPRRAAKPKQTRKAVPAPAARKIESNRTPLIPGEYLLRSEPITANEGRAATALDVSNTGDRPVQVGSHFHFYEVNRGLSFDRELAYGKRLNIPAGTAVRFEPGQKKKVTLVPLGGRREVWGLNAAVNGPLKGINR